MTIIKEIPGSIVLDSASGGSQGDGTLNAKNFFKGGVEVESNNPLDKYFNSVSSIESQIDLTTTSLTTLYQYTKTGRAVITSIIACNTNGDGGAESEISAFIRDDSQTTDFSIGSNIPVLAGTAVELLKRPKVLEPQDSLKFEAKDANAFTMNVTIAELDDNSDLFNDFLVADSAAVGNLVDVYNETNANGSVVESILLSSEQVGVTGTLVDLSLNDGTTDFFAAFELNVPEKTTIEVCEGPKFIPNGGSIRIRVSDADNIIAHVSGKKK